MNRIVYLICQIAAPEVCEEQELTFAARVPVACVYAAGSELEAAIAPGWRVAHWRCAEPLPAADAFAFDGE